MIGAARLNKNSRAVSQNNKTMTAKMDNYRVV